MAAREFARLTKLVSASLFSLVSDFDKAKENVSGPIAIVGVGAEVMRTSDLTGLYQFASVININLAVVNALPLPALDGGFLLLIAIEAARGGKKLPTEVEQSTASGVLLLLGSGMFLIPGTRSTCSTGSSASGGYSSCVLKNAARRGGIRRLVRFRLCFIQRMTR